MLPRRKSPTKISLHFCFLVKVILLLNLQVFAVFAGSLYPFDGLQTHDLTTLGLKQQKQGWLWQADSTFNDLVNMNNNPDDGQQYNKEHDSRLLYRDDDEVCGFIFLSRNLLSKSIQLKQHLLDVLRRRLQQALAVGDNMLATILSNRIMVIEADRDELVEGVSTDGISPDTHQRDEWLVINWLADTLALVDAKNDDFISGAIYQTPVSAPNGNSDGSDGNKASSTQESQPTSTLTLEPTPLQHSDKRAEGDDDENEDDPPEPKPKKEERLAERRTCMVCKGVMVFSSADAGNGPEEESLVELLAKTYHRPGEAERIAHLYKNTCSKCQGILHHLPYTVAEKIFSYLSESERRTLGASCRNMRDHYTNLPLPWIFERMVRKFRYGFEVFLPVFEVEQEFYSDTRRMLCRAEAPEYLIERSDGSHYYRMALLCYADKKIYIIYTSNGSFNTITIHPHLPGEKKKGRTWVISFRT